MTTNPVLPESLMSPVQDYVMSNRHRIILTIAWVMAMLATAIAYWPALQGSFVFDDFTALSALGNLGGVRDWETFKAFVLGGISGPTGRPLAMLSFLIDAHNWPADAWGFKRTNLIIHLANGLILGVLTRQILVLVGLEVKRACMLCSA
jgi:hypothetical protein